MDDIWLPSKHFLLSKTSWRRLQRNTFRLPRRLQDALAIRLPKTSSRRVCKASCNYVFKTSSRRVCKTPCNYVFKTSWKTKKMLHWRRLEDVFSTSLPRRMFAGFLLMISCVSPQTLWQLNEYLRYVQRGLILFSEIFRNGRNVDKIKIENTLVRPPLVEMFIVIFWCLLEYAARGNYWLFIIFSSFVVDIQMGP